MDRMKRSRKNGSKNEQSVNNEKLFLLFLSYFKNYVNYVNLKLYKIKKLYICNCKR